MALQPMSRAVIYKIIKPKENHMDEIVKRIVFVRDKIVFQYVLNTNIDRLYVARNGRMHT